MVIHTAGLVGGIHTNMNNIIRFLTENWTMGQNVILSAKEHGVKNLLNLASTCMYPKKWSKPIKEDSIFSGELESTNEGYAIAKAAITRLCSYISRESKMVSI